MEISENGNLFANSHTFLFRCKYYFSQLLNSSRDSEVRQMEYIYTAEALVPEHSLFEIEIAMANLKQQNTLHHFLLPTD
jgi:hypothetical protein